MILRLSIFLTSLTLTLAIPCPAQPVTPPRQETEAPPSATVVTPEIIARDIIAPLLDPAKVATLKGDRPANTRLYRILYWLETARLTGGEPKDVIDAAQTSAGYAESPGAKADKQGILWSRAKLEEYGCYGPEGMEKLRKGGSPAITRGEHAGDSIALDHVLPRAVVPELAARFYNLEAIPAKANLKKSAKISKRELELARRWQKEGLLSAQGLKAIEEAGLPVPAKAVSVTPTPSPVP